MGGDAYVLVLWNRHLCVSELHEVPRESLYLLLVLRLHLVELLQRQYRQVDALLLLASRHGACLGLY